MTPQTVNAYYDPSMNSLNVPAGILQPPYFDMSWPDAVNYGATGATIGHEMTHGFDDEGAKFDGHGNLKDWWAPADLRKFREATRCIAEQYSRFTVGGGLHVQGELVTGEAAADLGGLMLAWRALHALAARRTAGRQSGLHAGSAVLHRVCAFLGRRHSPGAGPRNGHHGPAPAGARTAPTPLSPTARNFKRRSKFPIRARWSRRIAASFGEIRVSSRSFSLSRIRTGDSAL